MKQKQLHISLYKKDKYQRTRKVADRSRQMGILDSPM